MNLEEEARRRSREGQWLARMRTRQLSIQAAGSITVQQAPPREGTVVRMVEGGVQREWAVPGWHDWLTPQTTTEEFRWLGRTPVAHVPLADKIARARDLQARMAGRDPRLAQAVVLYEERLEDRRITTADFDRIGEVSRILFGVMVMVHDRGRSEQGLVFAGRVGGFEVTELAESDLDAVVENAVRMLEAASIEPGRYRVVTSPEVSGVLAHEAFGHGVEMDLFLSHRAKAQESIGHRVGSGFATIIDDPTLPGGYGGYPFDDDGNLAAPHTILDRGTLVGGLADADVAAALRASGGNGRRQDYSRKVYPRMSNTFFASGTETPEALIAGVEEGVYLRRVESGMEDPKNWGMQITIHSGEEIRDGRLTGRLYRTMAMTGFVPDVLTSIDGAASDFAMWPGMCGKGHKEWCTNGTGGPHLRMTARLG
ncbi:MAG: TldD/PmbA family protein [Clostridia bacterium]